MAFKVGNTEIEIIKGDITLLDSEAIVNPANNQLMHLGGLAAAIVHRGGQIIQQDSKKLGFVPTGGAVYTKAGNLKAKYVVHAVGPHYKDGKSGEKEKLENAVKASLDITERLKLKSIAIPAISAGIFGYPIDECAQVIMDSIVNYLESKDESKPETTLEKITVCLFDDKSYNEFEKVYKTLTPSKKKPETKEESETKSKTTKEATVKPETKTKKK